MMWQGGLQVYCAVAEGWEPEQPLPPDLVIDLKGYSPVLTHAGTARHVWMFSCSPTGELAG